ncbi:hypothetical protein [Nonomuraea sp. NPDC050310]|uniref:hypothetical protein n=1 Tax=Nonomuraea sp. NPDC050310 TaxID=3154935 RepID=UPI003409D71D
MPATPREDGYGYLRLTAALSAGKRVAISVGHFRGHAFYWLFQAGKLQTHHIWGAEADGTEPAAWVRALGGPMNVESLTALHAIPAARVEGVLGLLARVTRTPDASRFLGGGYSPGDESLVEKESWGRVLTRPDPDEPRWMTSLVAASRTRPRWYRMGSLAFALVLAPLAALAWWRWSESGSGWTLAMSVLLTLYAAVTLWGARRPST